MMSKGKNHSLNTTAQTVSSMIDGMAFNLC